MRTKKGTESLADYVSRHMRDGGLSLRDVEQRSRRGGLQGISRPHINKIANGDLLNPSPERLKALARGLNRPEEEVFNVVLGTDTVPSDFEKKVLYLIAGSSDAWTDDQRTRFLQSVELMVGGIRAERVKAQPSHGQRLSPRSKRKIPFMTGDTENKDKAA